MLIQAVEHGPHRRGPPLASALTGRDIVTVEPARDLGEGGPNMCAERYAQRVRPATLP
jgi:hypothetical protein